MAKTMTKIMAKTSQVNSRPSSSKKQHLPEKDCLQCSRPFAWRRKWERCWDEVRFCSERCKGDYKRSHKQVAE